MDDSFFTYNILEIIDADNTLPALTIIDNNLIGNLLLSLLSTRRPMIPSIQGYTEEVIPTFISEDYRVHFRLRKEYVDQILERLGPKLITEHTGGYEQIQPRKQLLMFLCYMANNETFREIGQYFGVGKLTAHKCIARVLDSFNESFVDVIEWSDAQKQNDMTRENQIIHGLPNIFGAIDGTNIRLTSCPGNDSDYINRKRFPSMQLQIVVDHNLTILDAYTGWPGCAHDARVLRNSSLYLKPELEKVFTQ